MKNFYVCIFLVLVGILFYGLVIKGTWGNTPESLRGDLNYSLRDKGRLLLTQNLVEDSSFALTREEADIAAPDAGFYKGNWYLLYPPGMSIFAVPFYIFGSQFNLSQISTFAMGGMFSIATIVFIFLIAKQILMLPYWASILASLIFGFASTSFGYATTLFQHNTTAFFIISGFYAVYRFKTDQKWGFLWGLLIWTNYGLAIIADYPNAILLLPIMVYFLIASISLRKEKQSGWKFSLLPLKVQLHKIDIKLRPVIIMTSTIFIVITFLHGYYNYTYFGAWSKVSGSLPGYREGVAKILDKQNLLEKQNFSPDNDKINNLNSNTKVLAFFRNKYLLSNGYEMTFSPDRGMFIFSPVLILGLLGIAYASTKMNLEKGILISIAAINFSLYSLWGDPWAGASFGPRYLIPLMPILALFVSYFLTFTPYKLVSRLVAFMFIIYSLGVALLGALTTNSVPAMVEGVVFQYKYGIPSAFANIPSTVVSYFSLLTHIPIRETLLRINGTDPKYGFIYALDLFNNEMSASFVFNNFFRGYINLTQYYFLIFGLMISIFFFVLFIMPKYFSKIDQ